MLSDILRKSGFLLNKRKNIFFTAIIAIVVAVFFAPIVRCLSISNRKNASERYLSRNALSGFVISYTHSVNKGRVHDFYECRKNMLVLTETHFVNYGAGMSEAAETADAFFEVLDDGYAIKNLERKLKKMTMAVSVVAEHSILIHNTELFLKSLFLPQTSLVFEIKRVSMIEYLFANHI